MKRNRGFIKTIIVAAVVLMAGALIPATIQAETGKKSKTRKDTMIVMTTSKGPITIKLFADKAPKTVENFLKYVDEGFFDGTIFHRVIPGFMIQGGGFTTGMNQKPTHEPVKNEAENGLKNTRGTLAMARTMRVDSATAQFFINLVDNRSLDHRAKTTDDYGYCVFGEVVSGMEIVDEIAKVQTSNAGGHQNVPVTDVLIQSAKREGKAAKVKKAKK